MNKKYSLQQVIAFTGGLLGLLAGLVIGLRRFGVYLVFPNPSSEPSPPSGDAFVGQLAFLLVFTLPFVLSLLVLRSDRTPPRAVVWIGAGLLALAGAVVSFSFLTQVLLPLPGLLLLVAGGMAFTRPEVTRALAVVAVALVLVVAGGAAFITLFTEENPACWSYMLTETGGVWERSPENVAPISAQAVPANPGPGDIVRWSCVSDVIGLREGWTSLGIWAAGLGVLYFASARRVYG